MIEYFALIAIVAVFCFREYTNYKERKNLMDRFMSRDYVEYKAFEKPEEEESEEKEKYYVDIEDAKEEILEDQ